MSYNFEEYIKKFKPHPETTALLKATSKDELDKFETKLRRFSNAGSHLSGTVAFDGSEKEIFVPSQDVKGMFYRSNI